MRLRLSAETRFILVVALAVSVLRLLIFDFPEYFERRSIPNHDMYQGAGLFCPNMHSLRIAGDLAWWSPAGSHGGYAQCYNAFFSPLAPTCGHIVTIVWSQAIAGLSWFGVAIPEYYQYLAINFALFPFLAYLSLAWLAQRLFRSRVSILLIVIVYAFSGIGLWNSAWFYYQEAPTVFFLLGAFVAVCQRPTLRRGIVLLAAILVQLAAANYWTVYNSWFVLIFVGSYGLVYRNQVRRLAARCIQGVAQRPGLACGLSAACVLVAGTWISTLGCLVAEQMGKYIRHPENQAHGAEYTEMNAFLRIQETRRFTTELFNPRIGRALKSYSLINEAHNARYLGAALLPLLAAFWFLPMRRRELFLGSFAALILVVCLAPPWLLKLWDAVPFMDNILHLFYFYSHHLQLCIVLLSLTVLDRVLARRLSATSQRRLSQALAAFVGLALLCLALMGVFSHSFAVNDPSLEAVLVAALLALVGAFITWQCQLTPRPSQRLVLCSVLAIVITADLTRYYWEVSRLDQKFTVHRFQPKIPDETPLPLPSPIRAKLRSCWQMPRGIADFRAALYQNMPVASYFWPTNVFNRHRYVHELLSLPPTEQTRLAQPLLAFHAGAVQHSAHGPLFPGPASPDFQLVASTCTYNEFEFDFATPHEGFAVVDLLHDVAWQVELDGQRVQAERANLVGMSVPVTAGRHRLRLAYRPLARSLYWPACWLLEAVLGGLAIVAISLFQRQRPPDRPAARRHSLRPRFLAQRAAASDARRAP